MKNLPKTLKNLISKLPIKSSKLLYAPLIIGVVIAGITLLPRNETRAWYDSDWGYRKKLTVDNTKVSGSSNLTDFPVLVSITDTGLKNNAQADGDDILFTNTSDTKLSHEIESYDSSTGELIAWVKIPTLSHNTDTEIYMYYGNSSAASQEDIGNVWNSNYKGVWHLPEDPSVSAPQMLDSTSNNNDGTSNGSMTSGDQVAGKIDGNLDFDGTDDYIDGGNDASVVITGDITVSLWIKMPTKSALEIPLSKYSSPADLDDRGWVVVINSNGTMSFDGRDNTSTYHTSNDTLEMDDDQWHHIVGQREGSVWRIYTDGSQASQNDVGSSGSIGTTARNLFIGADSNKGGMNHYEGLIDEARVYSGALSSDWIATEYNNQNSPNTFLTVGSAEEFTQEIAAYWRFDEGHGTTANDASGNSMTGTITGATWQGKDMCISDNCLQFDGTDDYVDIGAGPTSVGTVSFWARPNTDTEHLIDLNGSAYISASNGIISATGFTSPTIYVNGVVSTNSSINDWQYRKKITIDSTQVSGSSSHANFPVLISLSSDSGLAANAQADGDDILFKDSDGTQLDHEIETFDSSTGELVAWVRIPSLSPTTDTEIYLYYGNSSTSNQENATGVWNSDYNAVWHLAEDPSVSTDGDCGGGTKEVCDSTSNNIDGDSNGSMTSGDQVTGKVNGSLDFDAVDDWIDFSSQSISASASSISFWFNVNVIDNSSSGTGMFVGKSGNGHTYIRLLNSTTIRVQTDVSGTSKDFTIPTVSTSTWYHLTITRSSNTTRVYLNGTESSTGGQTQSDTLTITQLARYSSGGNGWWYNGKLDNVRISSTAAFSSDWTATEYNNQNSPGTFFTVGSEEDLLETTPDLVANEWRHITVTTGTSINASDLDIGRLEGTDYFQGFMDEIRIYDYARTAAQIKQDLASRGAVEGTSIRFGDDDSFLSEGLVGYWSMEDNVSGDAQTIEDKSGNDNDGTTENGGNGTGMDCTVGAKFGFGCNLDGTDDYIQTANNAINRNSGSISGWIKRNTTSTTPQQIFLASSDSSSDGFGLPNPGDDISIGVVNSDNGSNPNEIRYNHQHGTGDISLHSGTTISADTWYHFTAAWEVSNSTLTAKLYLNGGLVASGSDTVESPATLQDFNRVGSSFSSSSQRPFPGKVDNFRVYNRTLSDSEVQDLYKWAPGPIAEWNMNENTGTSVNDTSGKGTTGTFSGDTTWVTGKYGSAVQFDGVDDCVDFGSTSILDNIPNNDFTVSYWASLDADTPNNMRILNKGNNKWIVGSLGSGGDPKFSGFISLSGTNVDFRTFTMPRDRTWHHYTAVYDSTNLSFNLYIDGIEPDNYTFSTTGSGSYADDASSNLYLGAGNCSTVEMKGAIDDVRIYNYARTSEQILEDMNAGHPAIGTPIGSSVLNLKFDEGYGTTANDSSPQDNDGTINGASWTNDGKFGKALDFDGSDDYVEVSDDEDLDFDNADFSVMGWFNRDTATTDDVILAKRISLDTASDAGYIVYLDSSGDNIIFEVSDGTDEYTLTSSSSFTATGWNHFVIVWDDDSMANSEIYINGEDDDAPDSGTIANIGDLTNAVNLRVGSESDGGSYFDGKLDEVHVYPLALSSDHVKTVYNQTKTQVLGSLNTDSSGNPSNSASRTYCIPGDTSTCNAPVFEMDFENKSGATYYETSENGNDGTAANGPVQKSSAHCKSGRCLEFDGDNDNVQVTDDDALDLTTGITLQAWVNPNVVDATADRRILTKDQAYLLDATRSFTNKPTFYLRIDGDWRNIEGNTSLTANEWTHVSATYDTTDKTMKLYLNGDLDKSETLTGLSSYDIATNTNDLYLASLGGSLGNLPGTLDQVLIYDYARSPAQIAWDMNKGAPVGWWKFDECEGTTANDASGSGNDGTITSGAGTNTSAGTCSSGNGDEMWDNGTNGKWNASLDFDGSDDYVDTTEGSDFSIDSFTVSAWVKEDSEIDSSRLIVDNRDASTDGWLLNIHNDDTARFTYNNIDISGTTSLDFGNWYHLVGIADGTNIKLYVNGKQEGSTAQSGSISESTNLRIGARSFTSPDLFFNGQIDDVRVYNYDLTEQQIKQLYNSGSAIRFD